MPKYFSFVCYVPLIFVMVFATLWLRETQQEKRDLEEYILERQINHASDAAVDAMLSSDDLALDSHSDAVAVNPDIAVREFTTIMCSSFGMPVTEETIRVVQANYIEALLVCAYDGVYAYTNRDIGDNNWKFITSPKIPYFYTKTDVPYSEFEDSYSDLQVQYVLNLGLKKGYKDTYDQLTNKYKLEDYKEIDVPVDVQLTAINNDIASVLAKTLEGHVNDREYNLSTFTSEISGAQPVKNISVIGIVRKDNGVLTSNTISMGIGGSRIVENDPYVGIVYQGVKYYVKQSKLYKLPQLYTINETFTSVYEAASHGYHCYVSLLD